MLALVKMPIRAVHKLNLNYKTLMSLTRYDCITLRDKYV